MIVSPKINQPVRIHYAKKYSRHMPHHGRIGHVQIISRGPGPRNHGIRLDGRIVAIPCGNLQPATVAIAQPTI